MVISPIMDWGLSAFELLVNFCLMTGMYLPIRPSGAAGSSCFIQYKDEAAFTTW